MQIKKPPSPQRQPSGDSEYCSGLGSLPYDVLLNIATFLDLRDVHVLHLTCRTLYDASTTRTVYRKLACDLLRRCRALPLKGFQRLSDLTTAQLIWSVNKATHYETAWRTRSPRPIVPRPHNELGINPHSNYMDVTPGGPLAQKMKKDDLKWYKVVSAPPGEEVDWLSPITSSYTLCATKSGKVVCWDVQTDTCLAEWNPGPRWELWKCRVEFEERAVFFTMAKVLCGAYDDDRVMEFVLMRLAFSDGPSGESSPQPPIFSHVTEFRTTGVVMNVFLLDPSERLLSAFIWIASLNTIGLYALLDWDKKEYIFINTGIECISSSNWSCILHQQHIVIHCEESEAAYQHFYPLSLLRQYTTKLANRDEPPSISCRLPPARTLKKKFVFPPFFPFTDSDQEQDPEMGPDTLPNSPMTEDDQFAIVSAPTVNGDSHSIVAPSSSLQGILSFIPVLGNSSVPSSSSSSSSSSLANTAPQPPPAQDNPNPYPLPLWLPESAHFVRQWWPSLSNIPRVSCTVILLTTHDHDTHRSRFVLAQHYFRVPLNRREWENNADSRRIPVRNGKQVEDRGANGKSHTHHRSCVEETQDEALMHLWYVSTSFDVVRVAEDPQEEEDDAAFMERPRPLVAVDFGHAVWIEYMDVEDAEMEDDSDGDIDEEEEGDDGTMMDDIQTGATPTTAGGLVDSDPKRLRFVTFPPFVEEGAPSTSSMSSDNYEFFPRGVVHTLPTPPGLQLGLVETINIDQSQGAVILSDKEGKIWILCYE